MKWNYITKPRLNWSTIRESSLDFEAEPEYHSIRNYCPCGRHFYDPCASTRVTFASREEVICLSIPIYLSLPCCVIKVDGKIISWIMIFKFNRCHTRIVAASIIILFRDSYFKKEYLSYFNILICNHYVEFH